MAKPTPPKETGQGTGEPGWTPQEKGQDASGGDPAAGAAGDGQAKGKPHNDREATERAAERTEHDPKP